MLGGDGEDAKGRARMAPEAESRADDPVIVFGDEEEVVLAPFERSPEITEAMFVGPVDPRLELRPAQVEGGSKLFE